MKKIQLSQWKSKIISLFRYSASRISFDLMRKIRKRKETLRAASRFFDSLLIQENGQVSPVSSWSNPFFTYAHDHSRELLTISAPMFYCLQLIDNGNCLVFWWVIANHWFTKSSWWLQKKLANLEKQFPAIPMLFVISPLNSLITNQINACERMGIKACKVDTKSSKFND